MVSLTQGGTAVVDLDSSLTGYFNLTGSAQADIITFVPTDTNTINVNAGDGNDRISAAAGVDSLSGGLGDDVLSGLGGNDTILGGLGADVVAGVTGVTGLQVTVMGEQVTIRTMPWTNSSAKVATTRY